MKKGYYNITEKTVAIEFSLTELREFEKLIIGTALGNGYITGRKSIEMLCGWGSITKEILEDKSSIHLLRDPNEVHSSEHEYLPIGARDHLKDWVQETMFGIPKLGMSKTSDSRMTQNREEDHPFEEPPERHTQDLMNEMPNGKMGKKLEPS